MILGVDVSKWQGEMSWEVTAAAGAQFAFVRAGSIDNVSGNCYTDYQFVRNASFAPEHMATGYYWYFRPNHDATKQANYFCDLIENEEQSLPPVLDLETSGNKTPLQVTNASATFIARVYERLLKWPIVYSRSYFLHDQTVDHPLFHECDLWVARYTLNAKPWGNPGDYAKTKPPYWDDWKFWQYIANSNRAEEFGGEGPPGGDDDIDLNYFNGDEATFNAYINKPQPPAQVQLPASCFGKLNFEIDGKDVKYQGTLNLVE